MKMAFLSDIHGNTAALEAVLEDISRKQVDKIFVLGDIAYRGPEPAQAIELVRNLETTVIKGNADEWVVRGVKQGEVPDKALDLMNKERDWTVSQLDQEALDYLDSLPTEIVFQEEGIAFHAFHATPDSLFTIIPPDSTEEEANTKLMNAQDADVYLYAHIHKAYIRYINGKTLINLGSVGLPFDGMPKASYAMVDVNNGTLSTSIERVNYNLEQTIQAYKQTDYPNTEMMEKIIRNASV